MSELPKGCSSHACMVNPPGEGQVGTNSAQCYCPEWKIRLLLKTKDAEIERLKAENEALNLQLIDVGLEYVEGSLDALELRALLDEAASEWRECLIQQYEMQPEGGVVKRNNDSAEAFADACMRDWFQRAGR